MSLVDNTKLFFIKKIKKKFPKAIDKSLKVWYNIIVNEREVKQMGYFYTGFDYKNRKNGYFKIGETGQKYLSQRLQVIQHYDSFECLGYLILKNETLSERRLVESYVRVMLERVDGLTQTQNDHYTYVISDDKYRQAYEYAEIALAYATAFCEQLGIEYERGAKKYKRK